MSDLINELRNMSGNEVKLLVTLSYLCGESQDFATHASNKKLADISGVSLTGISTILKSLQETGFITGITMENKTRKIYLNITKFQR